MKRWVLSAIAAVVGLAAVALFATVASNRRGQAKAEALVRGSRAVELKAVQIDYQQRRVICTDPVALRYFEDCLRASDTDRKDLGTTYLVLLSFADGDAFEVVTHWSGTGFSLSMPDEDPVGECWPTRGVVFHPPVPPAVIEMIAFLDRPWREVKGTVFVMEPGGIRREFERSLVAE